MKNTDFLTIGELARRVNLRTSALRYYEDQGLIKKPARNQAGYRLYTAETEQDLRFIQRAQRLGFTLSDIRTLLSTMRAGQLDEHALLDIAEKRYLELEYQATLIHILQHELGHFLKDILQEIPSKSRKAGQPPAPILLEKICSHLSNPNEVEVFFDLLERNGCQLRTEDAKQFFEELRGVHTHIWQEEEDIYILVVSQEPKVGESLRHLSEIASQCKTHADSHLIINLENTEEGYRLQVRGKNAFIFARLFLLIENSAVLP